VTREPRWAVAHRFPAQEQMATVGCRGLRGSHGQADAGGRAACGVRRRR